MATISSPGWRPARAAGDPGATATTRGRDIARSGYRAAGSAAGRRAGRAGSLGRGCGPGAAGVAPGLLRRGGDGHQGPGLDDPGVRAAGVLLPRDRPQPGGGGAVPPARAWSSSTTSPRCPEGAPLMLSAHGSPPAVVEAARARGGAVVNAVCPLVKKVHHEVKVRAGKGYTIVYVGHEGHQEAIGTAAVAPDAVHRVEQLDGARGRCPIRTGRWRSWPRPPWPWTSGRRCSDAARDRWPDLWVPGHLGPVLRHHQPPGGPEGHRRALRRRGGHRLGQLVQHPGPGAHRVGRRLPRGCCGSTRPTSCPTTWPACVGVIAGASAPEELVAGGRGPAGAPRRASRRSGPSTRTSTSRCPGSCATPSGTWPRPRRWPAWPRVAIRPPAAPAPDDRELSASVALAGLTR